ncbi:MAG: HAD family hydrolase [Planctomycetota bacterium]|nr:HAD family hydrolase [Planctomycetota bacterium]
MYDLIISDIDGCLAPEDSSPMDLAQLTKIAHHNQHAFDFGDRPKLTLCTGRPIAFVEGLCRILQNRDIPCVAENGVWLYDPRDNGYHLDPTITPAQLAMVRDAEQLAVERFHDQGVTLQPGKTASVTLYHPDPGILQEVIPQLTSAFEQQGWNFRVSPTLFYINCDLPQISKASGIDRLLASTGVDPQRTAGIGDTTSDLAIADRVETFGCPANAMDEVKEVADFVSDYEEVEGVLDFMHSLESQIAE